LYGRPEQVPGQRQRRIGLFGYGHLTDREGEAFRILQLGRQVSHNIHARLEQRFHRLRDRHLGLARGNEFHSETSIKRTRADWCRFAA
jgi:hypothetical protein